MSYELPVLSSNIDSLKEILENSTLYFNPKDEDDLLNKLNIIISNDKLRENLKNLGLKQIKKYSWSTMVKKIINLYNI